MNQLALEADRIFLVAGYTDLRLDIDSLVSLLQYRFNMDPHSSCLFLFCGRRTDRIKGLLWEKDGFLLLYKRLDDDRFRWSRNNNEVRELSAQQLKWLLEGLSTVQKAAVRRRGSNHIYFI